VLTISTSQEQRCECSTRRCRPPFLSLVYARAMRRALVHAGLRSCSCFLVATGLSFSESCKTRSRCYQSSMLHLCAGHHQARGARETTCCPRKAAWESYPLLLRHLLRLFLDSCSTEQPLHLANRGSGETGVGCAANLHVHLASGTRECTLTPVHAPEVCCLPESVVNRLAPKS
jgi:hypothetical protein